jgi:hypothetical protein
MNLCLLPEGQGYIDCNLAAALDMNNCFERFSQASPGLTPTFGDCNWVGSWPEESFNASWEVMWYSLKSQFPHLPDKSPSGGSVAKARGRLPPKVWEHIFEWIPTIKNDTTTVEKSKCRLRNRHSGIVPICQATNGY